jgi:hypothetical protein
MVISMDMADKDAFEVSQSLPCIGRSRAVCTEIPNELAPSAFSSIKKNVAIFRDLYKGA